MGNAASLVEMEDALTHFQSAARQILRDSLAPLVNEPGLVKGVVDAQSHSAWLEYTRRFSTASAEVARAEWNAAKKAVLSEMFPKWFECEQLGDGSLFKGV